MPSDELTGRVERVLEDHGSRIGSLEGRMLVIESIGEQWIEAAHSVDELRVSAATLATSVNRLEDTINDGLTQAIRAEVSQTLGSLIAQTRITWALLFAIITALIGVAITIFARGVP